MPARLPSPPPPSPGCRLGLLLSLLLPTFGGCSPADHSPRSLPSDAPPLPTALWIDATEALLGETGEWTNKVELADLDGDGWIDLLFANGGDYSTPGEPEPNRAFLNRIHESGRFEEHSEALFGTRPDLTRVIRARDFNGDGITDVFVGNTYQTRNRLFLGEGGGRFREVTDTHLPALELSLGDAAVGDVDGDGHLDLVLADWGPGNNMTNQGGRTRLWLNDGTGRFTDATEARMPATLIRFSWDLELVDVDNDLSLDILISCKRCAGSTLFRNDGTGHFTEDLRAIPPYTNNYEFEAMDLDGDGFLDLVTLNDGEVAGGVNSNRSQHVFRNDGTGRFRDMTDVWWPAAENPGEDDNVVAFLDYNADGHPDLLIGSLSGPNRLVINDGTGRLRTATDVFVGEETPGTLGMALADLDGDGRLDVVQGQGEHPTSISERIHLGSGLPRDTLPPVITLATATPVEGGVLVRARIHDGKSPSLDAEWERVELRWEGGGVASMRWYGEYLWRGVAPVGAGELELCATDRAGNGSCSPVGNSPDPT